MKELIGIAGTHQRVWVCLSAMLPTSSPFIPKKFKSCSKFMISDGYFHMILPCNLEFPPPNTFSNEANSFRGYRGPFF